MPSEADIVSSILRGFRGLGAHAIKTHGSAFSTYGTPDVIACIPWTHDDGMGAPFSGGQMVVCEVKRPGQKLTPAQAAQLGKWRAAGALALGPVTSWDQVHAALAEAGLTTTPVAGRR